MHDNQEKWIKEYDKKTMWNNLPFKSFKGDKSFLEWLFIKKTDGEKYFPEYGVYSNQIGFKGLLDDVIKNNKKKISLLDAGGGIGIAGLTIKNILENKGVTVKLTNIDLNEKSLKMMKLDKNTKAIKADLLNMPVKDNTFDYIILRNVLNYNKKSNQIKLFKELYKVLKVKGKLYIYQFHLDANVNDETKKKIINKEVAKIALICSGILKEPSQYNLEEDTYFPTVEEVKYMAKESNFKFLDLSSPLIGICTMHSFFDRWKPEKKKKEMVYQIFDRCEKLGLCKKKKICDIDTFLIEIPVFVFVLSKPN